MEIKDNVLVKVDESDIENGCFIVPSNVTKIGNEAFMTCFSLEMVIMSKSVTEIGDKAFLHCPLLKKIDLPDNVTKIGSAAFAHCESLESVKLSDNITIISDGAFSGCMSLEEVKLPKKLIEIEERAFELCTSLKSIDIPNTVKKIGNYAFDDCHAFNSIVIPDSVVELGMGAISNCESLTAAVISANLKSLEMYHFLNCISLEKINFRSSLTSGFEYLDYYSISDLLEKITIYGRNVDISDIDEGITEIRKIELFDKIKAYLKDRNISNGQCYDYDEHKKFIKKTIKKYDDSIGYYYKDDFDIYMEKYIMEISSKQDDEEIKNMLGSLNQQVEENAIEVSSKQTDKQPKDISESLKELVVKDLDSSDIHSIVAYGNDLNAYPNYFTGVLQLITNHYGIDSGSANIKKVVDSISKPQNLAQFLSAVFDTYNGGTKYYLNKESLSELEKFADINVDRLTHGIEKAEKLKEETELYMDKIEQYINKLSTFEPKEEPSSNLPDELKNPLSLREEVNNKLELYQAHMAVMTTFYQQLKNLIDQYTNNAIRLKSVQETLLPGVKMASSLNRGIIRTQNNIAMLEEILSSYNDLLGEESEQVIIEDDKKLK